MPLSAASNRVQPIPRTIISLFEDASDKIIIAIFRQLQLQDLLNCAPVCKKFKEMTNKASAWRGIAQQDAGLQILLSAENLNSFRIIKFKKIINTVSSRRGITQQDVDLQTLLSAKNPNSLRLSICKVMRLFNEHFKTFYQILTPFSCLHTRLGLRLGISKPQKIPICCYEGFSNMDAKEFLKLYLKEVNKEANIDPNSFSEKECEALRIRVFQAVMENDKDPNYDTINSAIKTGMPSHVLIGLAERGELEISSIINSALIAKWSHAKIAPLITYPKADLKKTTYFDLMDTATDNEHSMETLQLLHSCGVPYTSNSLNSALRRQRPLDIIQHLYTNDARENDTTLVAALTDGFRLDVLEWILENTQAHFPTPAELRDMPYSWTDYEHLFCKKPMIIAKKHNCSQKILQELKNRGGIDA